MEESAELKEAAMTTTTSAAVPQIETGTTATIKAVIAEATPTNSNTGTAQAALVNRQKPEEDEKSDEVIQNSRDQETKGKWSVENRSLSNATAPADDVTNTTDNSLAGTSSNDTNKDDVSKQSMATENGVLVKIEEDEEDLELSDLGNDELTQKVEEDENEKELEDKKEMTEETKQPSPVKTEEKPKEDSAIISPKKPIVIVDGDGEKKPEVTQKHPQEETTHEAIKESTKNDLPPESADAATCKLSRTPAVDPRLSKRKPKPIMKKQQESVLSLGGNYGDNNKPRRAKKAAAKSVKHKTSGQSANGYETRKNKMTRTTKNKNQGLSSLVESTGPAAKKVEVVPAKKKNKKQKDKKDGAPEKASALVAAKVPRSRATLVFTGIPNEPLEGGWPSGWVKRIYQRESGMTKGSTDRYWYTPITQKKLRSMTEVRRFMAALKDCEGDEVKAWQQFRLKKGKAAKS